VSDKFALTGKLVIRTYEEASHKRGQVTIPAAPLPSRSKSAEPPHVVPNATEKRVPAFLPLVFASLYKDAARKTEWFFAYAIS